MSSRSSRRAGSWRPARCRTFSSACGKRRLLSVRVAGPIGRARAVPARATRRHRTCTKRAGASSSSSTAATRSRSQLVSRLVAAGFPVLEFSAHSAGLEDLFIEITEGPRPVSAAARLLALARRHERPAEPARRQGSRASSCAAASSCSRSGRACWSGLTVASFGAASALGGSSTSGRWTFALLMGCLALLGLAVVPLGAFSALRHERLEQTLELITLTALSPRRIVDRQAAWRRS